MVPTTDNFFATLNSAVFSDGSFVYVPKGVRCPMELSTYFRINASNTGQFERTLIVADEGSYVSYLEGCTAPMRDENQLHAAVVELVALEDAQIKYSTVQNWYPGDKDGNGGIYNFVTKRGLCAGARSKISWTQVETGSAITWKYPSCILKGDDSVGEFYSVALTNNYQQADTGTKMIHVGKNTKSTIVSKGISAGQGPEHLSRSGEDLEGRRRRAQLLAMRLDVDRQRSLRRSHLSLYRRAEPDGPDGTRGDDLEDRGRSDLLLQQPWHRHGRRGFDDRQRLLQDRVSGTAHGVRRRSPEAARGQPRRAASARKEPGAPAEMSLAARRELAAERGPTQTARHAARDISAGFEDLPTIWRDTTMLTIKNLHASVEGKEILKGIDLEVETRRSPRHHGAQRRWQKSTLAQVMAGRKRTTRSPRLEVTFQDEEILEMDPEERAREGLFLAFPISGRDPRRIQHLFLEGGPQCGAQASRPGRGRRGGLPQAGAREDEAGEDGRKTCSAGPVNDGFSGGEKKRNEIFHMAVLDPTLAVLDETDSGLDIDALRIVADGVNACCAMRSAPSW